MVEHELLLFAGVFFLLGSLDELAVDLVWLWLKVTGRARTRTLSGSEIEAAPLSGIAAVFVPAWQEAEVIGATVRHACNAWPHDELRLYIGCYRNDMQTAEAVIAAAAGDPRLRLVIHDRDGPSSKADCLNRLYRALIEDERRSGSLARMVVIHDAEDMVDPAALGLLDAGMARAELVQLPVLPAALPNSRWIASHYCEEFAEAHAKGMVVREALSAGLPTAGVGCAIERGMLSQLAEVRSQDGPFAADCLTEDYELGLGVAELGGRARFVRSRAPDGQLVATRAVFPSDLGASVRQKTRWVHGIALQSWERLGWGTRPVEMWMRMRDRRGPLTALVLAVAYVLLVLIAATEAARLLGAPMPTDTSPLLRVLLWANLAGFAWRAVWRFGFTAREYGVAEGLRAVLRIPVANIIAIMSGRRALAAYVRSLRGQMVAWDKTSHVMHPALSQTGRAA